MSCNGECHSCHRHHNDKCNCIYWTFRSEAPYKVYIEFYSDDRDRVWPGNGEVYYIADNNDHTYKICGYRGEKICYGAWVSGNSDTYWGVGKDARNRCRDCCYTCGDGRVRRRVLKW